MERNKQIDISKGIAIILMILGHSIVLTDNFTNYFFKLIYSFHMPLFFLFSGYHFRTDKEGGIWSVVLKGADKLIKPYVITAIIGFLILLCFSFDDAMRYAKGCIVGTVGSTVSKIRFYTWQAGPIWFLLALFWCKLYFALIFRYCNKWWLEVSVVLSVLFIFICYYYINIPLCVGAGFTVLVFYATGLYIKEVGIDNIQHRWLIYLFWIASVYYTELNTARYTYGIVPLSILGAVCGTIATYDLSAMIKGRFERVLIFAGVNSLSILCCHALAFISQKTILIALGYTPGNHSALDVALLLLTVVYIIIYVLYKKILNRL